MTLTRLLASTLCATVITCASSFGFLMDPLERIQSDHDTTFLFMKEADKRGYAVIHILPKDIRFEHGRVRFEGRRVTVLSDLSDSKMFPFTIMETCEGIVSRESLDAMLIRTDPPFDRDYLAITHLLELASDDLFIMNHPRGVRDANEKLGALNFPSLGPATCVSQVVGVLERFRMSVGGDMVLKPIDGYAGKGVLLVRGGDPNRSALIEMMTRGGRDKVVAQALVPEADAGDRRILLLDGRPLGAILRKNETGAFVHNLAAGGQAHRIPVRDVDLRICEAIAPWLRARGLWFVGIDILGDKLIEINVTSPTGAQEWNRLEQRKMEEPVLDFVESRVRSRDS